MRRWTLRRRLQDRRRLPTGQARLMMLQTVLLAVCVLLGVLWARQDWRYEQAESLMRSAATGGTEQDPWGDWLARRGAVFALGAALLLLSVNAGRQGARTAQRLERERRRAFHDALTRLPNRRAFDRRLKRLGADASSPASLLFIDLDGFKQLNDTLGHEAGDAALVRVAAALRHTARSHQGMCCRWGGDEFAVLLPQADRAAAERVAARLEQALQRVVVRREGGGTVEVRGSIGIATLQRLTDHGHEDLLRIADEALAAVKRRRHGLEDRCVRIPSQG